MNSGLGLEEKISGERSTVSDQDESDSFVMIEIENLSGLINKDFSSNSRITRSLSRKGSQRGNDKKISSDINENDGENTPVPNHSPARGSSAPEKAAAEGALKGRADRTVGNAPEQVHHQITVTACNTKPTESRTAVRHNSFKRSSFSRILDPKRTVLFFGTLSSMGSILLITFTLLMRKPIADEIPLV